MIERVKVVLRDGSEVSLPEWQLLYGLQRHTDQIGKHFRLSEPRLSRDITTFGELIVNELLIAVLDTFRDMVQEPVIINSFNRTPEYHNALKGKGFRTALYSPHVAKMAADIDTESRSQTHVWVDVMKKAAAVLKIKVRVGYQQYLDAGQTFIHVDVCPEYYAPGQPYYNRPHPKVWEKETTW